jgi:hypothetical protein
MIDNLELVLPHLSFKSSDDFYYVQILQRKKENPELGSNSRVIKNYYITSEGHLFKRYDEMKKLCEVFNARASIRLNKRSFEKVGFKALTNLANTMANKEYSFLKASYDRACGLGHNDPNKTWIVDVDTEDVIWLDQIVKAIAPCEPLGEKILTKIPSKSGLHLITKPFNIQSFQENLEKEMLPYQIPVSKLDIHKDNPTNLYIP